MTTKTFLMRMKSAGSALVFLLGACTIHPQPKDVTGVPTFDIVQQIRCETRQAVLDTAFTYLRSDKHDSATRETANALYEVYIRNPSAFTALDPKLFKGEVQKLLTLFWTTGVAYNFNLDMTETNNADGTLNFGNAFTRGVFALNLKSQLDLSRQNTRTFTVTDHFGSLVRKPPECAGRIVGPNYIYPIAGRIGVEDMVDAFVLLSLFANLGAESNAPGTIPNGPPTLVDALLFTTTISGEVNPQVTFAPLQRNLSVTSASLDLTASRIDKHQVVVGFALDSAAQPQLGLVREGLQGHFVAPMQTALFGRLLTASGNRAELAAAAAVDQYLTQKIFSPTINITP